MDYTRLFSGPKNGNFVAFIDKLQQNSIMAIKRQSETAMIEKSEFLKQSSDKAHMYKGSDTNAGSYTIHTDPKDIRAAYSPKSQATSAYAKANTTRTARTARTTRTASDKVANSASTTTLNQSKSCPGRKTPSNKYIFVIFALLIISIILIIISPEFIYFAFAGIFALALRDALRHKKSSQKL